MLGILLVNLVLGLKNLVRYIFRVKNFSVKILVRYIVLGLILLLLVNLVLGQKIENFIYYFVSLISFI